MAVAAQPSAAPVHATASAACGEVVSGAHGPTATEAPRLVPPPPLPRGITPQLVGVLSSHVGDEARLDRLRLCLQSVCQQTQQPAAFFAVWSASEALAAAVVELFAGFRATLSPSPVHAIRQTQRASQFHDLRVLYNELLCKEPPGTWLLFTDDDDLWGPERVRVYSHFVTAHASAPHITAVCASHKVRPLHRDKVAHDTAEVERQLAKGDATHCGGVHLEEEFFDFSCPCESLGAFLSLCNDATLLHPFADLRFTRFLSQYYEGNSVVYFPTDGVNPWVYYYSTAYRAPHDAEAFEQYEAQDQASTVVRRRPEDIEEATGLCRQAACGRPPGPDELESMVDFVATLRQNIEAILIRHFPEDPMSVGEMKRIAVGQCQGHISTARLAEKLARDACTRFGIRLEERC
eukprot:NODE_5418_length_1773_cov_3.972661.p1 GENE.NODE_5418_length_1773_cov_3.972661~~NODE_5418_length_1773_cov_3.972661.p1  ORF type:complete len:406 (+),score=99.01 NODE_5418_length_1773_cov_3.972661:385-1602(+)